MTTEPTDRPPDWSLVRSFVEVVRTGSLTAAARNLGTTQPTVGRHIRQLEAVAGDVLFDRRDARLVPTERALDLFPWAERVASEVTAVERAFALPVADVVGPVRVTTSEIFAVHVLPGLVGPLIETHPGLSLEIVGSDAVADLLRRDADLAVRFVRPTQPDLIARKVGEIAIGLYATSAYLKRAGHPESVRDLTQHRIVGSASGHEVEAFARDSGLTMQDGALALRSDSLLIRMAMVRASLGIGPLHLWLAEPDDALERVLPDVTIQALPVWLVAHGDLSRSRRLRITFDHLAEGLMQRFTRGV